MKEKNSNVMVLTIIVIATMIVVLVGATFAYLASDIQTSANTAINATTNAATGVLQIQTGSLVLYLDDAANLPQGGSDLSNVTNTMISLTDKSGTTYKYDIVVNVENNDFEYSSGKCYNRLTETSWASDYANCEGVWGINSDTNQYACYSGAAGTEYTAYITKDSCLESGLMWAQEQKPELIVTLFEEGTGAGKCYDASLNATADSKVDCEGIWIDAITDATGTYMPTIVKDITEVTATQKLKAEPIEIKTAEGRTSEVVNYRLGITLLNLPTNQFVNGEKSFIGNVELKLVEEP